MKMILIISSLLFSILLLYLYLAPKSIKDAYIITFETLLEEENAFNDQVDYISLFINEESVEEKDLVMIKKHIEEKYNKEVFTYMPEEINSSGPYGKEDLSMDGMFLYIMEIEQDDESITFSGEKYHTVAERGALGMEIVVDRGNDTWKLEQADKVW